MDKRTGVSGFIGVYILTLSIGIQISDFLKAIVYGRNDN